MSGVRLTAAQAAVRFLAAQHVEVDGHELGFFAGAWAIFGHGNVAGLGEALRAAGERLPTYRAHNEQAMAHSAIAYAKQMRRERAMICTTSIGPGATNMVTAAALAHVSRLPVLLLPGDVFASRRPDPVLQQVEDFADGGVSANDCFRPVSRYFDRIVRPEQLLTVLPRAMSVLTDPADCGPVTLAFCQDVQTEACEYPQDFFRNRLWRRRRQAADPGDVETLAASLRSAKAPLIVAGGGVHYAGAHTRLAQLADRLGVPVAETQAGKGSLAWNHPMNVGAIGVTGSSAANRLAAEADLVVGLGTRLQDFTTGSRALFGRARCKLFQVNVSAFDACKHGAVAVIGDADAVLCALHDALAGWTESPSRRATVLELNRHWTAAVDAVTAPPDRDVLPSDAQVIGALQRTVGSDAVVVCAAGGLPGELHKLWRTSRTGGYHVEYGYSCMGYEIAGGLGVKMAAPDRDVHVLVGDGSYLMLNSEIATSVMLGLKLTITVLDNRGFGCIDRLQRHTGGAAFNNLLVDARHQILPRIDFAAHAASLGAQAQKVANVDEFEAALQAARTSNRTSVIVIETDPTMTTQAGGAWWDVAVPEVSERPEVRKARVDYEAALKSRRTRE